MARRLDAHMKLEDARSARNGNPKWHVGKEIPIATIVVLILQTVGVIWVAATTFAKVDFMKEASISAQIVQTAVDRKQDEEAQR